MPEILTESFCERCGTRYTFESVAPRKTKKLGQFKTLSKGVKNWVMSDDSSLDEAMAAARSDEEREQTAQQLDAFHSTFNFCMNCRQYTCSNCWNGAEGRCLSCAPNLGQEALGTPFPAAVGEAVRLDAEAWPEVDIGAADNVPDLETLLAGGNGVHHHEADVVGLETNGTGPATNGAVKEDADFDPFARLAFLTGEAAAPAWPAEEPVVDAAAIDGATDLFGLPTPIEAEPAEPAAEPPAAAVQAEPAAIVEPVVEAPIEPTPAVAAQPVAPAAPALPDDVEDRAAALSSRTTDLLGRFRPGQNIDAELAAYEAELDARERAGDVIPDVVEAAAAAAAVDALVDVEPVAAATPVPETPVAETEAEDGAGIAAAALAAAAAAQAARAADHAAAAELAAEVAAQPEGAPEPEPAAAEPEPVAAEAESAPVESKPAAPETAAPEPPARQDRIEQPTWRIYAPDGSDAGATPPVVPGGPAAPQPTIPVQASGTPQWPSRPDIEESPSMALLANRARAGDDALWAASTREVLGPTGGPAEAAPVAGVQPCSNCGLSLSANARFCRRCGTRQG